MATIYIDPSASVDGNGTMNSPFNTWASVTWSAGNDYLQRAGTSTGRVDVGSSGTVGSRLTIGRYGEGPNPKVGVGGQYGIYMNARQYIDINDIDATGATDHGFYIRTGGSNIQSITLNRCRAYNNQNNGFFLDGVVLTATLDNVTFNDCEAYDNLEHGFDTLGIITNITWNRCKAARNGLSVLGHGFSLHPFISNNITSGWTNTAGNVYQRTLSAGETVQKLANITDEVTLTKNAGAGSGVGLNEWDQSGTTLYINIGKNPSGITIAWKRATHGPFTYNDCVSWDNYTDAGPGEGHGFAADDMSSDVTYNRCISYSNEGGGFQNQWTDNVKYYSCVAFENELSNWRTTGHTDTLELYNCVAFNGGQHGILFETPFTGTKVVNSISVFNGVGGSYFGIIAGATGTTANNNCVHGNGTGGSQTSNITNTNGINVNPGLDTRYKPTNLILATAGSGVTGTDLYGNSFRSEVVGAVDMGGNGFASVFKSTEAKGNSEDFHGKKRSR